MKTPFLGLVAGGGIVLALVAAGVLVGIRTGTKSEQRAAVLAGAAYYHVNPTNGVVEFRYRTPVDFSAAFEEGRRIANRGAEERLADVRSRLERMLAEQKTFDMPPTHPFEPRWPGYHLPIVTNYP